MSALKFDETLSKVRFHITPKKDVCAKEEMQKLKTLPIFFYFLQDFLFNDFQMIVLVKQYEDFLIVINENEKRKKLRVLKKMFLF